MLIFLNSEARFATDGSFMHMVNHSFIKLVLFMVAGIIYMNMHNLDTINRGNHIKSYDFLDELDDIYDDYDIIDFEEEEINYDE